MNDDQQALAKFTGTARLFPLPNLVLFPHVVQPLHVFEPRYRQLTTDCLDGDRLMALVLLQPGWEENDDGRPAVNGMACLGRVVAEQVLPDGRSNLLLRGLSRLLLQDELSNGKLYRTARAKLVSDGPLPTLSDAKRLRRELAERVLPRFASAEQAREQLRELFTGELPLGALCDILSFALPLPVEHKQTLLELLDVTLRAEKLLELLDTLAAAAAASDADRKFPPDFSAN